MPLRESLALARLAEEKGYHRLWVGEDLSGGDVFAYLSVLACRTSRIKLATGITSPWVRNLGVIANSAAGIQGLSGGRFSLGLGVGGLPELIKITGSEPRRVVARMREAVSLLRRIFKGKEVTYKGRFSSLRSYALALEVQPPRIYLGVRGPKLLALAGEMADGVIFSGPRRYLEEAMKIVDAAAAENGRDPGDIERVLWNAFVLTTGRDDLKLAKETVRAMLGSMPSYALEELCIYGSREEILRSLKAYASMGFSEVIVGPPYGRNAPRVIATMGDADALRREFQR